MEPASSDTTGAAPVELSTGLLTTPMLQAAPASDRKSVV
jgi:hypothetical protein